MFVRTVNLTLELLIEELQILEDGEVPNLKLVRSATALLSHRTTDRGVSLKSETLGDDEEIRLWVQKNWGLSESLARFVHRAVAYGYITREEITMLDDSAFATMLMEVRMVGLSKAQLIVNARRRAGHAPDQRNSN